MVRHFADCNHDVFNIVRGREMYLTYSPQYFSILEDKPPREDINYYKILS